MISSHHLISSHLTISSHHLIASYHIIISSLDLISSYLTSTLLNSGGEQLYWGPLGALLEASWGLLGASWILVGRLGGDPKQDQNEERL